VPRNEKVFRVFVAAPDDVEEECEIIREIVDDLNITSSKNFSVRLDLLRWTTHCYPSVGEYAQNVVNNQIGDDYDIFIGILWKKFGTPTSVASSGTEEEFQRAYERYQQDPKSIKILFYFKDAGISSLSELGSSLF
jgi:hypothetical protein